MYLRKHLKMILFTFAFLLSVVLPAATAEAKRIDINYGDGDWCGYENEDGTLTITGCRNIAQYINTKTLTIPTEVGGKKVTRLGIYNEDYSFYIFDNTNFIETLILPDTIEHVDGYQGDDNVSVFSGYTGLKKVVLPDNESFNEDDVKNLFQYNSADVEELTCRSEGCIPSSWRSSLETLSLHDATLMPSGCSSVDIDSEYFPNLKTLTIQEAVDKEKDFRIGSLPVTFLTLPADIKSLTMYDCPSLTELSLPSGLNNLDLTGCPVLTKLSLPGSLKRMRLLDCTELSTLESEKAQEDISIETVYNCPKLAIPVVYVKYGEDFGTSSSFGGYAPKCGNTPYAGSQVQEIHIDSRRIAQGINKQTFRGTSSLKAIVVEGNASNFFSKDGVLYWKATGTAPDGTKITGNHMFAYPAAKSTSGNLAISADVSCIYAYALEGCKFSTITFPENMHPYYEWDSVLLEPYSEGNYGELADFCSAKFRIVKNSSPDVARKDMYVPEDRVEYYKGSTFKIKYNLYGGKNNANPSSYTAGETITLKNPSRSGYTFLGWTRNDSKDAADYKNTTERGSYFCDYTFTAHWMRITGMSHKIAAGKKIELTAEMIPADSKNPPLSWSSSNQNVATVSKKGVVTFKKNTGGKSVTITAKLKGGSGKKAAFKLQSMKGIVKKVKLSGKNSLKAGKSTQLSAKVTASSKANKTLSWSSSNKKYATVSDKGKVTAKKAGRGKKVTITAKATDGSGKKGTFKITIK